MSKSKTFCPSLWYGLDITTRGGISPCCFWEPIKNIASSSLEDYKNCEEIQTYRRRVLNGEQIEPCNICYGLENRGIESQRITYLRIMEDLIRGREFTEKSENTLGVVSLRFSNKCNLHCIQCGNYNSSVWEKIFKVKIDINTQEQQQEILEYVKKHSSQLREIYLAGGEPVLIDACWELLEFLIENRMTNITLKYNSNLTTLNYKGKNIVDYWEKWIQLGGALYIGASIDAVGSVAESLRQGCKWKDVDTNIKEVLTRLSGHGNFTFRLSPCISILNVIHIPDLITYMIREWNIKPHEGFFGNMLIFPVMYNVRVLPEYVKQIVLERVSQKALESEGEVKMFIESYRNSLEQVFKEHVQCDMGMVEMADWYNMWVPKFNEINPEIAGWWLFLG